MQLPDALDTEPEHKAHVTFFGKLKSGLNNPFILLALGSSLVAGVGDFLHLQWDQSALSDTVTAQQLSTADQIKILQQAITTNAQQQQSYQQQTLQQQAALQSSIAGLKQGQQDAQTAQNQILSTLGRMQGEMDNLGRSGNGFATVYHTHIYQ